VCGTTRGGEADKGASGRIRRSRLARLVRCRFFGNERKNQRLKFDQHPGPIRATRRDVVRKVAERVSAATLAKTASAIVACPLAPRS